MKVYLCGGIHGLSDDEATKWRERAKALLRNANVLDPMRRDYRGVKADNSIDAFVQGDLRDIAESDVLLVNATRPSWGTAMEIVYARILGRRIVAFLDSSTSVSPWLHYHCDAITPSLEEAVARITDA
jgi:nucleoside 2-deoxyribosyltransferase